MTVTVSYSDVREFANHCFYLRGAFRHLPVLYEISDSADKKRMDDVAPFFSTI